MLRIISVFLLYCLTAWYVPNATSRIYLVSAPRKDIRFQRIIKDQRIFIFWGYNIMANRDMAFCRVNPKLGAKPGF